MNDEIEVFLNKVDAFAQGLEQTEQAMLAHLIRDESDDDVEGFHMESWPANITDIAPRKIADMGTFLSSGHATGSNVKDPFLSSGHATRVVKTGGGSSI